MDQLDMIEFGKNGKYSIATQDLNFCHAVAIVPRKAAQLVHIAPNSPENQRQSFHLGR